MPKQLKFGAKSTADEVASGIDLTNKIAIVTGANTGIGYFTARALVNQGAHVVIACRDVNRGQSALDNLKRETGRDHVELMQLDLASFESIRSFVKQFKKKHAHLHYLINNAGGMLNKRGTTADGLESTIGINHVGPFLLTYELVDILKASSPARIVNLSSEAHRQVKKVNWDDLMSTKSYSFFGVYSTSKLFNVWHASELNKRLALKFNVPAFSLHPGVVHSDFFRGVPGIVNCCVGMFGKTSEQGAATSVYAALRADATNDAGSYLKDCKVDKATKLGRDATQAAKLWDETIKLCGLDAEEVEARFAADVKPSKSKKSAKKNQKKKEKQAAPVQEKSEESSEEKSSSDKSEQSEEVKKSKKKSSKSKRQRKEKREKDQDSDAESE